MHGSATYTHCAACQSNIHALYRHAAGQSSRGNKEAVSMALQLQLQTGWQWHMTPTRHLPKHFVFGAHSLPYFDHTCIYACVCSMCALASQEVLADTHKIDQRLQHITPFSQKKRKKKSCLQGMHRSGERAGRPCEAHHLDHARL